MGGIITMLGDDKFTTMQCCKLPFFHNIININFFFLFIYSHVHTLFGSFLHPAPFPHPVPPSPPQFQGPILPLSLFLLKKRHKHNEEDKAFLLVDLRIAIQRDS
jgi:hypothetical protein